MQKILITLGFGLVGMAIGYTTYAINTPIPTFTTNLSFGITENGNVTDLQEFLTDQGVYSGPITGNFFALTEQGVKEFQTKNNISPVSGFFGPLTRAKANSIIALSQTTSPAPTSTATTPPTTSSQTTSSNLLAYLQLQLNSMFASVKSLQQKFWGHNNQTTPNNPTPTSPQTSIPVPTSTPTSTPTSKPIPKPTPTPTSTAVTITVPIPTPTSTTTVKIPTSTTLLASLTGSQMLWGAYVGDIDATPSLVSSFATLTGASPKIIASFTDLSSGDFPSDEKTSVGDQGKTLLLFLEPQYSFDQINSGAYDSILQQYATAAAAYGDPIILAPFDEFNLNENPWGYGVDGNTPAKFIQAWQHIHSFFANDPNVKFALVYNNVPEPATTANSYTAYYPGSAYVDYVAVDGFNFGTSAATAQTFAQIFNPIMPTLESFNKPILFTSIGSLEYSGKAQWIAQGLGSYIEQYPNIVGWVYFNYDDTSAGQNWRIDTDPASLAAFQSVVD